MSGVDPKQDFRWVTPEGVEVEAYQISKATRFLSQEWPSWLQTQKAATETNRVYTDASDPTTLFICMDDGGRYALERNAYITHENGVLRVHSGELFERNYEKVVPFEVRAMDEESEPDFEILNKVVDGKLGPRTPEEQEEKRAEIAAAKAATVNLVVQPVDPGPVTQSQQSNLRPKAEIAFELLLDGDHAAGVGVLKQALADETDWCVCSPGQCAGRARWGCRQNSPLVK